MNINNKIIGFVGTGNMGGAIIDGLLKAGLTPKNIAAFDADKAKLSSLEEKGVYIAKSNTDIAQKSDIIILAVKPHIVGVVLKEMSSASGIENKIIVSIAAGLKTDFLSSFFKVDMRVVRAMPNTPAQVGEGMTVLCHNGNMDEAAMQEIVSIFSSVGKVEVLEERLMDAVTAISGSSPAYVYIMIEAMADAAVLCGMPRDKAYTIASQAVMGSAQMVLKTGIHPGALKDMVCSPGGTTIEAVSKLEAGGFRAALIDAVVSCCDKSARLGK